MSSPRAMGLHSRVIMAWMEIINSCGYIFTRSISDGKTISNKEWEVQGSILSKLVNDDRLI